MSKTQDIVDNYAEQSAIISGSLEANRKIIATVEALESLFDQVSTKQTLSVEDISMLNLMGEFAVTGTSARPKDIGMAFENISEPAVAMEGILESIQSGISTMAANSKVAMKAIESRFFGTDVIIQAQQKRLDNVMLAIKQLKVSGKKAGVRLSLNLPVGSSIVDKASYIAALKDSVDCITGMVKVWEKDIPLFMHSFLKTLGSFSGVDNYNDHLSRTYNDLNDLFVKLGNGPGFTKVDEFKTATAVSAPLANNKTVIVQSSGLQATVQTTRGEYRKAMSHMGISSVSSAKHYDVEMERQVVYLHDITESDLMKIKSYLETIIKNLKVVQSSGTQHLADMRSIYKVVYTTLSAVSALGTAGMAYQQFSGLIELAQAFKLPAAAISVLKSGQILGTAVAGAASAGVSYIYYQLIKFIAGWVFTTVKLQYKLTETVDFMDTHLMSFNNNFFDFGLEVLEKSSSPRAWV